MDKPAEPTDPSLPFSTRPIYIKVLKTVWFQELSTHKIRKQEKLNILTPPNLRARCFSFLIIHTFTQRIFKKNSQILTKIVS